MTAETEHILSEHGQAAKWHLERALKCGMLWSVTVKRVSRSLRNLLQHLLVLLFMLALRHRLLHVVTQRVESNQLLSKAARGEQFVCATLISAIVDTTMLKRRRIDMLHEELGLVVIFQGGIVGISVALLAIWARRRILSVSHLALFAVAAHPSRLANDALSHFIATALLEQFELLIIYMLHSRCLHAGHIGRLLCLGSAALVHVGTEKEVGHITSGS